MPGATMPLAIQVARASPIAREEENPDPLQPLATHRPARPGTGPATNRPSGLIVNIPPRCSATGAAAAGASAPTWAASRRSTVRSSGTSSVVKVAGCWRGSTGSGSASKPPTIGRPQVDRGIDNPDDWIGRVDIDRWPGDQ